MPLASDHRRRVLVAIIVYNGGDFVRSCIESAARLAGTTRHLVDVVVLDDCSPEPGWSDLVRNWCSDHGAGYYRSPRNLGIPRNMNLGLLRGLTKGFDHVIICNSDIVFPSNLIDGLVDLADNEPSVASVTAWSNNCSIFSLPNADPDRSLAHQGAVDFASAALHGEFADYAVDIPTAVGFCVLLPVAAVREVGMMDPVFGRGYCEEVDWSLRAAALGLRNVLAPGVFVYHVGSGSTRAAGVLGRGETSVWRHEHLIDLRHPDYRSSLADFDAHNPMPTLIDRATTRIVVCAAREWGYAVDASWLPRTRSELPVRFVVDPDGRHAIVRGMFADFEARLPLSGTDVLGTIEQLVGQPPSIVSVFDEGRFARELAATAWSRRIRLHEGRSYPQRV